MWNLIKSDISNGYHFTVNGNDGVISIGEALKLLRGNKEFREFFISSLRLLTLDAYRWETPGYTKNLLNNKFEFVVLNAPTIIRDADPAPFNSYIRDASEPVVSFQSLGKDAHLVAPTCIKVDANYCHLASFTNTAPFHQQHALWSTVGRIGSELASDKPVWLSTAGQGVAWLHIRFDSRPKYYHHVEYKELPKSRNR
ncbi:DUF6940 family protein [Microbulbifer sp. SSSA002]|uniref:DUF6940 family protein n=1 Tax=Microbulbifer sp. SSSA002 TaxID=3243376 RepID=UPI0040399AD7